MTNFLIRHSLAATLAALAIGATARADVVATFEGSTPNQTVDLAYGGSSLGANPVGPFQFTTVSTTDARFAGNFRSFCGDLFQNVSVGNTYTYQMVGVTQLPDIGADPLKNARIQKLFDRYFDVSTDAEKGGAFQLALWDVTYDGTGSLGLGSGSLQATGSASSIALANSWLSGLDTALPNDPTTSYTLVGLLSGNAQDQLTAFRPLEPVPAPAGLVLLAIGGVALVGRRLLAKKKSGTSEVAAV